MKKQKGFTLVELLFTLIIFSVVGIGMFSAFKYYNITATEATQRMLALQNIRQSLDIIKHDVFISKGIYGNDTPYSSSPSLVGNSTTSNQLIIAIPSINAGGEYIDCTNSTYVDYYKFHLNAAGELIRTTYRGNLAPGSARLIEDYIIAKNIKSLTFTDNGLVPLSSISDEDIKGMSHIRVEVKVSFKNTLGGADITETITTNISLRNF